MKRNILAVIRGVSRKEGKVKLFIGDGNEVHKVTDVDEATFDRLFGKSSTIVEMTIDTETGWIYCIKPYNDRWLEVSEVEDSDDVVLRVVTGQVQEVFKDDNGNTSLIIYDGTMKVIPPIDEKVFNKLFKDGYAEGVNLKMLIDTSKDDVISISPIKAGCISFFSPEEKRKMEEQFYKDHHHQFA